MKYRYVIWAASSKTKPGMERDKRLLLAGLGRRKDIVRRWRELTGRGDAYIPLQVWQQLRWLGIKPYYVRFDIYATPETRKEAEAILLNLRMSNRLLIVEDWMK